MEYKQAIDIRISNFINKVLNFYIRKRESNIQRSKNKIWEKNFKTSEYFIHKLDENLSIKLYKDSYLSKLVYEQFEVDEIDFVNNLEKVKGLLNNIDNSNKVLKILKKGDNENYVVDIANNINKELQNKQNQFIEICKSFTSAPHKSLT